MINLIYHPIISTDALRVLDPHPLREDATFVSGSDNMLLSIDSGFDNQIRLIQGVATTIKCARGVYWWNLTDNTITVNRHGNDNCDKVRVQIWKISEP